MVNPVSTACRYRAQYAGACDENGLWRCRCDAWRDQAIARLVAIERPRAARGASIWSGGAAPWWLCGLYGVVRARNGVLPNDVIHGDCVRRTGRWRRRVSVLFWG